MKLYHAPGVVMMFTNANLIVKHAQPVEDHTMSAQMIALIMQMYCVIIVINHFPKCVIAKHRTSAH